MDLQKLQTFVAVARERSITRASEVLHLSQPATSAHIKSLEDTLGVTLFDRTARGMTLTADGERLLAKAESTIAAHQELLAEASRPKGGLTGTLRLGAGSNTNRVGVAKLLAALAERLPGVEVQLEHGTSQEILARLRNGRLDAGFYNEPDEPGADLATFETSRFRIHVAAAPGLVPVSTSPDWSALEALPWIYPTASACCGRTAERLFGAHHIRPKRIVSVDREDVTRALLASRTGVGLLHAETATEAAARGEVELVLECPASVRVLFAHVASRTQDPLLTAVGAVVRASSP